ncbi:hypothetical protein N658DRAFT_181942 [Parathielavia hyrcaniae]|uniref:Uncharacterized protein n=1 Tax=Parathielavia hyrcaniae TaxID=113614 RepID=A0AAN6Q6L5_9PEZI|nr:hypothetical protein N658DRAFT_181942 [Parathielavia hyrcaniae]
MGEYETHVLDQARRPTNDRDALKWLEMQLGSHNAFQQGLLAKDPGIRASQNSRNAQPEKGRRKRRGPNKRAQAKIRRNNRVYHHTGARRIMALEEQIPGNQGVASATRHGDGGKRQRVPPLVVAPRRPNLAEGWTFLSEAAAGTENGDSPAR